MQRAKTLSGLALQALRVRWAGLGKSVKTLIVVGFLLAAATALQFSMCLLGGCPSSASPCNSPCEMADRSDEPCPFSAQEGSEAAEPAAAEDVPPCHAQ
ncbi:MAG: hypothetical protein AB8I08_27345 [Sandaracinaceae bacterium]